MIGISPKIEQGKAITLKTENRLTASKNLKATQINAKNDDKTSKNEVLSVEYVKNYIISQAKAENVSTTIVSWIVSKESQWGQRMVGDDGASLGVWMWDIQKNPWVSRSCALSLTCSTRLALDWLKEGKQNKWTTWRFRCIWYSKENPPDCKK
jgi:hypothetical protein